MDLDALKELARGAYRKEYIKNAPAGAPEQAFLAVGMAMWCIGCLAFLGGVGAAVLGSALAAPFAAGGFLVAGVSIPVMLTSVVINSVRGEGALERDIDNGSLVERFRKEILGQKETLVPAGPAAGLAPLSASPLDSVSAKAAFNTPLAANQAANTAPAQRPAAGPATPGA